MQPICCIVHINTKWFWMIDFASRQDSMLFLESAGSYRLTKRFTKSLYQSVTTLPCFTVHIGLPCSGYMVLWKRNNFKRCHFQSRTGSPPFPFIIIISRLWSRRLHDFSYRCNLGPKKKYWLQHPIGILGGPEHISNTVCVAFLAYASHAVDHTVLNILLQVHHHGDEAVD